METPHVINFTDEAVSKLFGKEAAEDEDFNRLQSYYIKSRTHEKLTANLPLRILVGHKGIGKSAIFTIARHEDKDNNNVSILIRPDDIANLGKNEVDFDAIIRSWKSGILKIITNKVCECIHYQLPLSEKAKDYCNLFTRYLPFIKQCFQKKLEDQGICDTDRLVVENFLRTNRIIVYVDDLDRGWESKKSDIRRISALLNAVRDLSNDNKGLQFRISLRADVFYLVRTSDESTDKIGDAVIWHKWTNHDILLLLIKRIETYFGKAFDVEKYRNVEQRNLATFLEPVFEKYFTDRGKWENKPMYVILMSLIRKRPRDLVKLCNAAAKCAYENNKNKIDTDCLKSVFVTYSHGRIQDTINEYRSEMKNIDKLLFNMKPSSKERKRGKGYIYNTAELHTKLKGIMEQGSFEFTNGKKATVQDLHHFLYKINFITARKERADGFIDRKYFEENNYLTIGIVDFGYDWEIHPAFRWALSPDDISNIPYKVELSADN